MDNFQALILGLVEGLTEYLPVSSTGHLLLAQRLMGIDSSTASDAFAICIQAGAILAVLGIYRQRVAQMVMGAVGRNEAGQRLLINLLSAFVPAAVLGLLLEKPIKKYLFGGDEWGLWPVVAAWFAGGMAILVVSLARRRRGTSPTTGFDLEHLTVRMALIVGLAQCIAMWPGVSRSLITIVGGVLVGLSLPAAVELSFLLGVITLTAATAYDALKHGPEMLATYGATPLLIGFGAAWLSAVLAVKWMVGYLKSHGMEIFGWYRVALALSLPRGFSGPRPDHGPHHSRPSIRHPLRGRAHRSERGANPDRRHRGHPRPAGSHRILQALPLVALVRRHRPVPPRLPLSRSRRRSRRRGCHRFRLAGNRRQCNQRPLLRWRASQEFGVHHVEIRLDGDMRMRFPVPVVRINQAPPGSPPPPFQSPATG